MRYAPIFVDITKCSLVGVYPLFGAAAAVPFVRPEAGDRKFAEMLVTKHVPDYTVS